MSKSVLGRLPSKEEGEAVDFSTDADVAILRQEPLRARVLLRSVGHRHGAVHLVGRGGAA